MLQAFKCVILGLGLLSIEVVIVKKN